MSESWFDRALSAAPVAPLPEGFRDAVMGRIAPRRSRAWELIVAAVLALPSCAYVIWTALTSGADFADTLDALVQVAQGDAATVTAPSFSIDGLVVLAVALMGLAAIVAVHALLSPRAPRPLAR